MQEDSSRVSFAMAEALAFGSLALHRDFRPPNADQSEYEPIEGLNIGAYSVSICVRQECCPRTVIGMCC